MTFSRSQIDALLSQQPITTQQPWSTADEFAVDNFYRQVCAEACRMTDTLSRIEWNHYGSGYASFVDAWFYRAAPGFDVDITLVDGKGSEHKGLIVLLSRLSPYFVFMEGEKYWHAKGGGGYLPHRDMTDRLTTPAIAVLAERMQAALESLGLVRLFQKDLSAALPADTKVPTILSDDEYTQFDALYYWED